MKTVVNEQTPLAISMCVGVPVTSLRELRVLQACRHKNIVELKSVATGRKSDRWDGTHCLELCR
eukprot:scaffold125927_cov37-Prasinocladus_malaysianus.AAC.1